MKNVLQQNSETSKNIMQCSMIDDQMNGKQTTEHKTKFEYFKQKVFVWSLYIVKQHAKKQKSRKCFENCVMCVHCTLMIINGNDKATQANTKFRYVFCYKNIYDLIEYIYLHSFLTVKRERERQSSENHLGF